jgi:hypothetical protein
MLRYVELLSDMRTPLGERRVSARRGWAGEKSDFFSILLETRKGEGMRAGQTARNGGQAGGNGEKGTPKEDEMNAAQSSDKRNDKPQEEKDDKVKGGY